MYQGQDIISETLSAKRGTRTFCTDSIVRKMSIHFVWAASCNTSLHRTLSN